MAKPIAEIDDHLTAIWDACDQSYGPAPNPTTAKNWTPDERRRAADIVDCFRWFQRNFRNVPVESMERMIGM